MGALAALLALSAAAPALAQDAEDADATAAATVDTGRPATTLRVVTYNVEHWKRHFLINKLRRESRANPTWPPEMRDLLDEFQYEGEEESWEVARVLLDPALRPDVLVTQESAAQDDLDFWNRKFMDGYFGTVYQFKTNTDRDQHLAIFLRQGFKLVKVQEYADVPDVGDVNSLTDKLYARGLSMALVETPTGHRVWVGTTHFKSKSGNSVAVAKWRNAECAHAHGELAKLAKSAEAQGVVMAGDWNDEIGINAFERPAGGDAASLVVGPPADGLTLLTRALADKGEVSFWGGYLGRNRSFIDHAVAGGPVAATATNARVFRNDLAEVASDHLPVSVDFDLSKLPPMGRPQ